MVVHTKLSKEELESAASAFGISLRDVVIKAELAGFTLAANSPKGEEFLKHLVERNWAERCF